MTDPAQRSIFLIQKDNFDAASSSIADDNTVEKNSKPFTDYTNSIQMTMLFRLPSEKYGCDDNDALIVAIQKMNEMIKALTNKLPCRVGPWNSRSLVGNSKLDDLLTILPEDVDFIESHIFV